MKKSVVESTRNKVRSAQEELTRRTEELAIIETRPNWYSPENANALAHAWQLKETATKKLLRAWEEFDAAVTFEHELDKRGSKHVYREVNGLHGWWAR